MVNIKMDTSYHENGYDNSDEYLNYCNSLGKIIQINTLIRSNYYCFSEKLC